MKKSNNISKITAGVIFLIIFAFCAIKCFYIIPPNNVGVYYSLKDGTLEKTLPEGFGFKLPIDRVYCIDTTVQERTIEKVTGQTKDAQWLSMTINVKYQVDPANAFKVYKNYRTLDNLNTNLIANVAQRCIESVTTKYNVIDVLGEERNNIYKEIEDTMREALANEGVTFKMLTIKDTDAGEAIEKAIQDEAVAKKQVETAEQQKSKAEIEAQTKLIEAQGEAEANAVKTQQLTEAILAEQWINKWNGELPLVSGETGNNIVDISSLIESAETLTE